ncbi:MAG: TIGR04282 family arsenosugar biosynthesis glycosyltransferase [Casimicrobiaceae bacterium]
MMPCVVALAKQPVAGQVKTRMALTLGAETARELYRCALADTVDLLRAFTEVHRVLSYAPDTVDAHDYFSSLASDFILVAQRGADLGERLLHTFQALHAKRFAPMVLIGSDTPSLPRSYVEQALALLDQPETDAVLGPAADGGYYLLGMRAPLAPLFQDIRWSTETVARQTRERAEEHLLCLKEVPVWYDLDTAEDLQHLYREVSRSGDRRAAHTCDFVRSHGLA